MGELRVVAERLINAPAERVYAYIADYREHHHRFLPPAFTAYQVERGGVGAGTVVRFRLTIGGRRQDYRSEIAEPEPGRVLTEQDRSRGVSTRFQVVGDGAKSRVLIETSWQSAAGFAGLVERLVAPRFLGRLYEDELARLDDYASRRSADDDRASAEEVGG